MLRDDQKFRSLRGSLASGIGIVEWAGVWKGMLRQLLTFNAREIEVMYGLHRKWRVFLGGWEFGKGR
jgi:hypothetical protein